MRRDYLLDTYFPAQFNWNGQIVADAGIRSRGSGSRSAAKPNLKVAFDKYDSKLRFFGLVSVILKANNQDGSLLREMVSIVEALDGAFLLRGFGEDTGSLVSGKVLYGV